MRRRIGSFLLLTSSLFLGACSNKASSSTEASASTKSASPERSASATAASPTNHIKRSQGECTFELDAPEALKETQKDGLSFTLSNDDFAFSGFEGQTLEPTPSSTFDMYKGEYEDVYRGTSAGLNLAIVKQKKDDGKGNKNAQISGSGGEVYKDGRNLGCTFLCSGARSKEAAVVAMCKSVRITVKPTD